ncbi:hypothetical protein ACFWY6_25180 [Streptomyces sp. NPDC059037]|uniref:hypothetical protein n=1 Tax=Streptomyces sp. NPDC059037 TaxID=3346710 RepID=UPI00368691B1
MSDFVGRLLGAPGPRLRPQLPTLFDPGATRLRTPDASLPVAEEETAPALPYEAPHPAPHSLSPAGSPPQPLPLTPPEGMEDPAGSPVRDPAAASHRAASPAGQAPQSRRTAIGAGSPAPMAAKRSALPTAEPAPADGDTSDVWSSGAVHPSPPTALAPGAPAAVSGAQLPPAEASLVRPADAPEPVPPSAAPPALAYPVHATPTPGHQGHPVRPVRTALPGGPPRPVTGPDGAPDGAAEPVVRITIDRLEVRTAPQPAPPARARRRQPRLGLDEYLRGRS